MGDLPQIASVYSVEKLNRIVYADEGTRKDKTLAYLNQVRLIDYNENRLFGVNQKLLLLFELLKSEVASKASGYTTAAFNID